MTTSSFVAEANKLKNIQLGLQKNEHLLLEHIAKYVDARVPEYCKELELLRSKDTESLRNETRNIFILLNKIKTTVREEYDTIDFKQLKKDMEFMSSTIQDLKSKTITNLDNLKKDEKELCEELKTYEQKVQEWEKPVNLAQSSLKVNGNNKNKIDQNVTDFLSFVAKNGGHENGWSAEDHNLFLKVKMKCKNEQEVAEHVHAILPDISVEEIIDHDRWYAKYLELKSKHKEAIKTWRLTKSAPKCKVETEIHQQIRPVTSVPSRKVLSREEIRDKVEAWRREKKEKIIRERKLKSQVGLEKKQLEEKRKQKYEHLKESVQNWRTANTEKIQTEKLERELLEHEEKEFRSAMANKLIKDFQSQDDIFMRKKMEYRKPKIKIEEKRSTSVIAPRDPRRLLKPTKQWISKTSGKESYKNVTDVCNIKDIPKLGVPQWRKQLVS